MTKRDEVQAPPPNLLFLNRKPILNHQGKRFPSSLPRCTQIPCQCDAWTDTNSSVGPSLVLTVPKSLPPHLASPRQKPEVPAKAASAGCIQKERVTDPDVGITPSVGQARTGCKLLEDGYLTDGPPSSSLKAAPWPFWLFPAGSDGVCILAETRPRRWGRMKPQVLGAAEVTPPTRSRSTKTPPQLQGEQHPEKKLGRSRMCVCMPSLHGIAGAKYYPRFSQGGCESCFHVLIRQL